MLLKGMPWQTLGLLESAPKLLLLAPILPSEVYST